jgi:hypothetical protein
MNLGGIITVVIDLPFDVDLIVPIIGYLDTSRKIKRITGGHTGHCQIRIVVVVSIESQDDGRGVGVVKLPRDHRDGSRIGRAAIKVLVGGEHLHPAETRAVNVRLVSQFVGLVVEIRSFRDLGHGTLRSVTRMIPSP